MQLMDEEGGNMFRFMFFLSLLISGLYFLGAGKFLHEGPASKPAEDTPSVTKMMPMPIIEGQEGELPVPGSQEPSEPPIWPPQVAICYNEEKIFLTATDKRPPEKKKPERKPMKGLQDAHRRHAMTLSA
jgi:hypothetical protein